MTDLYARYFRALARRRSAVASVALSHPIGHDCAICREARGEPAGGTEEVSQ